MKVSLCASRVQRADLWVRLSKHCGRGDPRPRRANKGKTEKIGSPLWERTLTEEEAQRTIRSKEDVARLDERQRRER